jgi:hypothetical protein
LSSALDVELSNARDIQSLISAVDIGAIVLDASAQVADNALGPPAGTRLGKAVEASRNVINAAIPSKSSKLKLQTKGIALDV